MTYEIVKEIGSENRANLKRESFLVKLGTSTVCRASKTLDLYEIDHVIVEALRIVDDGVVYEETHVVASDAEGKIHDSILYQATRALTVPEAMFSIGEHNYSDLTPAVEEGDENGETDAA